MNESTSKNRRVRDVVTFWPPSSWVSSYGGTDALTPRPSTAVIAAVQKRGQGVWLQVEDGGRSFSTVIAIEDPQWACPDSVDG